MKYLYQQSIVQYRTPVYDDGTIGNPEIIKRYTTSIKGAQNYNKKRGTDKGELQADEVEEIEI